MGQAPAIGDQAPDFELEGTEGTFRLSEHRGRPVVLLFYPGDFTPVCTRQFCSYADRAGDLGDLDAVVVGISAQDAESHAAFAEALGIPFALLADVDRSVARSYGALAPILGTRRALVVIDAEGRIAHHDVHAIGLRYRTVDEIAEIVAALDSQRSTSTRA